MKKTLTGMIALGLLLGTPAITISHPHFNKTITANLPGGVAVTIAYTTVPANEDHTKKAAVGAFLTPGRPMLKLSGDLKAGEMTIPAGDYHIGVMKKAENDWVLVLHPGQVPRGQTPDTEKLIKLDSMFSTAHGVAEHSLIDLTPGSGKFEGKVVLTIHFGSLFLAGLVS